MGFDYSKGTRPYRIWELEGENEYLHREIKLYISLYLKENLKLTRLVLGEFHHNHDEDEDFAPAQWWENNCEACRIIDVYLRDDEA